MSSMRCSRSRDAGQTNVHHIGGIPVQFPYQPYGSQLAFMGRVISTLDRAVRDGHSNAVLESPTGTGKTLSLLCSSLAWQENYKSRLQTSGVRFSDPASVDPLIDGGGFVPESQPPISDPANKKTAKKKKTAPTVFYASRTHSQITQVIREYRKTAYRVPMAVLGSRKHYCTNARARGKENIDEECRSLLDRGGGGDSGGCAEFKNYGKIKSHPSIQNGGGVHDIEDLVRIGESVRGCPYYASCSMAETAELIFCPYSYVINPIVRRAMNIDLRGSVLILDEAHNVEDTVRDSGSVEIEEGVMRRLQTELELLSLANPVLYQPLLESVQGITGWMDMRRTGLEKREFQNYSSSWTGDRAVRELEEAHISMTYFEILKECASKAIREVSDPDYSDPDRAVSNSGGARLTGLSATVLEELFSSLCYFFLHSCDYQLALQHSVKSSSPSLVYTFSLWCLNPAVVFGGIADVSLSVILTSGTLSPMNSFSSELGIPFAATLEAPHVIDVESQVWASVITSGPGNYPLNASYRTADRYEFQDELGSSLEQIFVVVPGGCLVFFPSYKLMEKMCVRWRSTGQWSRLNFRKAVFVESRSGTQDELESTLQSYYRCCSRKPRKRANKIGDDDGDGALRLPKGAAFLAVCRGKISEGIDFSDDHARAVIVVGIPFPNVHDLQVLQKKRYNDMFKASKNLLSGNEWYCHQAFRALNQAAGRCIRHRFDHGAVILMDERFREERNTAYVSKWLRNSIVRYDRFDKSLESLRAFFDGVKERIGKRMANCSPSIASRSVNRKKSASAIENQKLLRRLPPSLDFSSSPEDECDVGDESGEYSAVLNNPAASDDRIRSSSLATVEFSICRTPVVNRNASPGASDWTRNPVAGSVKSDADPASSFTPERNSTTTTAFPSVNSLAFKRRRPTCTDAIQPVQCLLDPGPSPDCDKENRELKPCVVLDKRLQIHCCVCRNPLGHSEGSQVRCSITAVSKGFLRDLRDEASPVLSGSPGTPVVMTDSSSVHARLVGGRNAGRAQCGVWREDDGCVFRAIYCPFCSTCDFCLGVQVMAADSANVHLLDKVVFFADRVQIKRPIQPKNDASS